MKVLDVPAKDLLRREIRRALIALFLGTGALALLSAFIPALAAYGQAGLAALLFLIPTWAMKPSGQTIDDLGVNLGPATRTLGLSLAVMAILTPLFFGGYHIVQTQGLNRTLTPDIERLKRWADTVEDPPNAACTNREGTLVTWFGPRGVWLVPPESGTLAITLRAPAPPTTPSARRVHCGKNGPYAAAAIAPDPQGQYALEAAEGLWIPIATGEDHLNIGALLNDRPVDSGAWQMGRWRASGGEDGGLDETRDYWWILTFIIIQLGLIALPEEWFFRGYLLPRLDRLWGVKFNLLGARIGWGLIASSLAFALLHPILIPGAFRLLVFFPSLLFGWVRVRSGNLGAAVVVHAACNLLIAVAARFYA